MKSTYTQTELDSLLAEVRQRRGWEFSSMRTIRQPVPWDYTEEIKKYLRPGDDVLDIGTGGGERFAQLASSFGHGTGTDVDPEMIAIAKQNAEGISNLTFSVSDDKLGAFDHAFDVIINRHAPFDLTAVKSHLKPNGYFITQQVGEKNMQNVKDALGLATGGPEITRAMVESSGLRCLAFREYNVEYVVKDIESLVFWLNALDMLHADLLGKDALASAETLNNILNGNVDARGFVTNEHRYLAITQNTH